MAGTERQPLLSGGSATPEEIEGRQDIMNMSKTQAAEMQQKADKVVNDMMAACGGETWCNYIVDKRQFEDYPAITLLFARVMRGLLAFFIVVCVIALVMSYFFEGKITTIEEIDQQEYMQAPNLAVCPQPWGTKWETPLAVQGAKLVQVPGGATTDREVNFTRGDCSHISDRLGGCSCFDFAANILHPHGERGNLEYFDYVRLSFSAGVDTKKSTQYAFGFYAANNRIPQQWTYSQIGHISEGDVKLEEVASGKTEFTEGTSEPRYSFRLSGEAPSPDGTTVLVFGFDKYLAFIISSFGNKFSVFAVMTVLITFCAAINNFGLFEIFFPEQVDDDEPTQLQPNLCCATLFGPCCMCCNPKSVAQEELAKKIAQDSIQGSPSPSVVTSPSPADRSRTPGIATPA